MKNCTHCKHAEWDRTAAGKLHPSGDGKCGMKSLYKLPPLPASVHWFLNEPPTLHGGQINRKRELRDHCTYYERGVK